jgi:pimeloyl-ACP methyl ester carboxylesterase
MPTVEGAGVELAYMEQGSGAAAVLAHGMAADAATWPLDAVPGRVIAYDRRGYGASGAPEPYQRTTVQEQAEDLAAVIERLGAAPALVVAADFAALAALDLLVRRAPLARAAVLIDPPLYSLVPEATESLSEERAGLEQALGAGGPAGAVEHWLGPDADAARRERARAAARAFFADYGGLATWSVRRAELRGIAAPVAIVTSAAAPAHARAVAAALLALLPAATAHDDWRVAARALA